MKKCLLATLVAVCTIVASGASAQQRNRPAGMNPDGNRPSTEEAARQRAERMTEALSLDAAQSQAVYDQCLRMAELQRQMAEARRENAAKMKQILNEEQYAKWQKMRKAHKHRGRGPEQMYGEEVAPCCENPCPVKQDGPKRPREGRRAQAGR